MASTITVETGEGITGANSFASVAEFDDYHNLRGNIVATGAQPSAKVAALVVASDYLNAFYRASAAPLSPSQGLQWPTITSTGLPASIKTAAIVLASYALSGPLSAPATRGVKATSKKLEGVGETSTTFEDAAPSDPYPAVTAMLAPIASPVSLGGLTVGKLTR